MGSDIIDGDQVVTKSQIIDYVLALPPEGKAAVITFLNEYDRNGEKSPFVPTSETPQKLKGTLEPNWQGKEYTRRDQLLNQMMRVDGIATREERLAVWNDNEMYYAEEHVIPAKGDILPEGANEPNKMGGVKPRARAVEMWADAPTARVDDILYAKFGEGKSKQEFVATLEDKASITYGVQLYKSDEELTAILSERLQYKKYVRALLRKASVDESGVVKLQIPAAYPQITSSETPVVRGEYRDFDVSDVPEEHKPHMCFDIPENTNAEHEIMSTSGMKVGAAAGFAIDVVLASGLMTANPLLGGGMMLSNPALTGMILAVPPGVLGFGGKVVGGAVDPYLDKVINKTQIAYHRHIANDVCPDGDGVLNFTPPPTPGSQQSSGIAVTS